MGREKFDINKALGSAANGAVVGAVRGALVGSVAGIAATLASNFAAGAAGNALEQGIGKGSVDIRESVTSGLTNAVSGAIYGKAPLKSAGQALWKGAASGAATAAINNLSNATRNIPRIGSTMAGGLQNPSGRITVSPYTKLRDPKAGCGAPSAFSGSLGYSAGYGYQYEVTKTKTTTTEKQGGFSFGNFIKDVAIGAAMGGLASVSFYGAGKAVEVIKSSIKGGTRADNTYELYRKEANTGTFKNLQEPMQLKNVKKVANEAGVGLKGIKVKIDRNSELLGRNVYGYTDGKTITLYPDAFTNTETLVKTLGHERMHVYQVGVFGKPTSTDVLGEFERGASMSEQSWWDYFNFKNGGR